MTNLSIEPYGVGTHGQVLRLGKLTIWFSYKTPVAYQFGGNPIIVRQNYWSTTTGKHLNAIDGGAKSSRIEGSDFERQLALYLP